MPHLSTNLSSTKFTFLPPLPPQSQECVIPIETPLRPRVPRKADSQQAKGPPQVLGEKHRPVPKHWNEDPTLLIQRKSQLEKQLWTQLNLVLHKLQRFNNLHLQGVTLKLYTALFCFLVLLLSDQHTTNGCRNCCSPIYIVKITTIWKATHKASLIFYSLFGFL